MKQAQLIHNPGAGNENHDAEELIELIRKHGYGCRYSSTKEGDWKDIPEEVDFLVVAGGDGTIRKITRELLNRKRVEKVWPIAVLPLGTANNIAKTLGLAGDASSLVSLWKTSKIMKYDVGIIRNLDEAGFFLESFGYGLFPYLMRHMKKIKSSLESESPQESLDTSLRFFQQFIHEYSPVKCQLEVDGTDYSGEFLMVEIMNSRSIGPNLFLASHALPDDGVLEVVVVREKDREKLSEYVSAKQDRKEDQQTAFETISGEEIKITWSGNHVHVDDEQYKIEKGLEIKVELNKGMLEFMIP
jgi:diacylglycerol kinase family enzyme